MVERLAGHFLRHYGAPDREAALAAAREEAEFAVSLCDHEIHTLLALERKFDGDTIVESFRVVHPPSTIDHSNVKVWVAEDE